MFIVSIFFMSSIFSVYSDNKGYKRLKMENEMNQFNELEKEKKHVDLLYS